MTTLNPKRFPPQTTRCVIAGLSNSYTQYIATYEEFQAQRYEAASTLYGPHTLAAYQQEYDKLATALATGQPISPGLKPLDLYDKQWSFDPGVIVDSTPFGKKFGDLYQDVDTEKVYKNGDVISAEFYGGHPKNNLMTQKTFLTIEKLNEKNQWISILVDGDWDTRWHWRRQWLSESIFTIIWSIGETFKVEPGIYRIHHFGYYKDLEQSVFPYDGTSSPFKVVA